MGDEKWSPACCIVLTSNKKLQNKIIRVDIELRLRELYCNEDSDKNEYFHHGAMVTKKKS